MHLAMQQYMLSIVYAEKMYETQHNGERVVDNDCTGGRQLDIVCRQ